MANEYVSTGGAIEVPFSDDEVERPEDENEDAPGLTPVERSNRKQRRTERIAAKLAEGKLAKEELAKERAEAKELRERLARLEGVVSTQQAATRPAAPDPYQVRLEAVRKRQEREYANLQAETKGGSVPLPPERAEYYTRVSAEIEEEKMTTVTERALARTVPDIKAATSRQKWEERYPDVYSNPRAYQFAEATRNRRLALGEQETVELVEEVMEETRTALKLGPKKGPTANERARMSGVSSSGSGGGNGATGGGIQMTKELRAMALSVYRGEPGPDGKPMTEEQAIKKWADTAGRELRKQKVL
jgi:hypothetical protein